VIRRISPREIPTIVGRLTPASGKAAPVGLGVVVSFFVGVAETDAVGLNKPVGVGVAVRELVGVGVEVEVGVEDGAWA
jgi:hypothetical protein